MPATKLSRRGFRESRHARINREHYQFEVDAAEALAKKDDPPADDDQPAHVGQQSNHLQF